MGLLSIFKRSQKKQEIPRQRRLARRVLSSRLPPKPLSDKPSALILGGPIEFLDGFRSHPGFGAGPQTLTTVFRQAENGWPARQCDLFEDLIENDGHLASLLQSRTVAVAGKAWSVLAGGDKPEDQIAAKVLEVALRKTNMGDLIAHQITARYFGYAGSEIVWGIDSSSGGIVPTWFVNVPCRRFLFDRLDMPRLITGITGTDSVELEAGRWMFSCNTSSGSIARSGLLRTASWWALFKRMCVRDWVIYCEKFGIPLVWGMYDEDAHDDDIDQLEQAVKDIGEAGQAIFSKLHDIQIQHSAKEGSSDSVFGALVTLCNNEMSKLILGATLTTETQGPGSFALGRVHQSKSFDLTLGDAEYFSQQFVRDVSRPFVEFNSINAAPPQLAIAVVRDVDPLTRAKIADVMANRLGLSLDEEQIRQEFQFKKPMNGGIQKQDSGKPAGTPGSPVDLNGVVG